MIYTPSIEIKLIVIGVLFFITNIDNLKYIKYIDKENLKEIRGQEILFCCFSNIFLLHLPSFLWVHQLNLSKCLRLLEHILHYYITLALVLLFFTSSLQCKQGNSEIMIALQMSFYYLWHIYHKIKEDVRGQNNSKCTIFPSFMTMTIYTLLMSGMMLLFIVSSVEEKNGLLNNLLRNYSLSLATEIGSVLFQWMEKIYSFLLIKNENERF